VGGRASRGSERHRGSLPYWMGRGRGAPSSGPRTSWSRSAVEAPRRAGLVQGGQDAQSRRAAFYCGFSRFSFILAMGVGTPVLLVPTVAPEPLGECVITLPEVCSNWSRSVVIFFGGGARAHPPSVAPEASVECWDSSEVLFYWGMIRCGRALKPRAHEVDQSPDRLLCDPHAPFRKKEEGWRTPYYPRLGASSDDLR
jgi:hypothetical protein